MDLTTETIPQSDLRNYSAVGILFFVFLKVSQPCGDCWAQSETDFPSRSLEIKEAGRPERVTFKPTLTENNPSLKGPQTMSQKITIDTAHAEIAKEIRLAKKRMFKAHRSGIPLGAARDAFIAEIEDVITEQDFQLRGNPPKAERIKAAEAEASTADTERSYKPLTGAAYVEAMRELGLDWQTIDQIAEIFTNTGDDDHLCALVVLIGRLARLANMKDAPESLDNFLPLLRDRFYRFTFDCEARAGMFFECEDQAPALRKGGAA